MNNNRSASPDLLNRQNSNQVLHSIEEIRNTEVITYAEVKHLLDFSYQLKDPVLKEDFHKFQHSMRPFGFLTFIVFTFIFLALPYELGVFIGDVSTSRTSPNFLVRVITSSLNLFATSGGCIASILLHYHHFPEYWCCLHIFTQRRNNSNSSLTPLPSSDPMAVPHSATSDQSSQHNFSFATCYNRFISKDRLLQFCNIMIFEAIFVIGVVVFLRRSLNVNCNNSFADVSVDSTEICYSKESLPFVINLHAMNMIIIIILSFLNLPAVSIFLVWANLIISLVLFLFVSLYHNHCSGLGLFVIWLVIGFYSVVDAQVRNILLFVTNAKLVNTLDEKEKNELVNRINEMRSLIGNVAHDLKTPLASFTSGIELIQQFMESFQEASISSTPALFPELLQSFLSNLQGCLTDISNTNSFMLMAINRCIDFTKASKGLKLIPRNETITLSEAVALPMNCMKNIQHRIDIVLKDIPSTICSHIITDKQWLQENILCLLSNAVKYSNEGVVDITISLVHHERCRTPSVDGDENSSNVDDILLGQLSERQRDSNSLQITRDSTFILDEGIREDHSDSTYARDQLSNSPNNRRPDGSYLRFEVQDFGIGVSEDAATRLFHPFNQTQRLAGGTGLGLYSLAKRLEALGGYYGVHNRLDGRNGSVFWIEIPYKADEVASSFQNLLSLRHDGNVTTSTSLTRTVSSRRERFPSPPPNSPEAKSSDINDELFSLSIMPMTKKNKLQILIADDSPSILKMTGMLLRRSGHDVFSAENGAVAVQMVQQQYKNTKKFYDLILMDLQMPVLDGLEAIKRIRIWERGGDNTFVDDDYPNNLFQQTSVNSIGVPKLLRNLILAVSANSDAETTNEAYLAGADGFLPKPFTNEAFDKVLSTLNRANYPAE